MIYLNSYLLCFCFVFAQVVNTVIPSSTAQVSVSEVVTSTRAHARMTAQYGNLLWRVGIAFLIFFGVFLGRHDGLPC